VRVFTPKERFFFCFALFVCLFVASWLAANGLQKTYVCDDSECTD